MAKKNRNQGGGAVSGNSLSAIGRQILDSAFANNRAAETQALIAQPEPHDQSISSLAQFYEQNYLYAAQYQSHDQNYTYAFPNQQREYFNQAQGNQHQMDYNNQYANSAYAGFGYAAPPGYNAQYAQQPQYQAAPPNIRNPFNPPPPPAATYAGQNAQFDPDEQQQLAQWQSAYAPAEQQDRSKKGTKNDRADGTGATSAGQRGAAVEAETKSKADDSKYTVVRKGGGESWEDKSLLEWDPTKFRIMVGNLAGEVTDDSLTKAFANYGVNKARVIRDKRTTKSKGFGFVEFTDGEQGFKAAREMSGKYIGSHPVTIQRARTNVAPIVKKDHHNKHKGKNNNHYKNKDIKQHQKDPLKANTGAGIEKQPAAKPAPGLKLLG
ncbi:hypothetical protein DOTSEDRAFT_73158 [Dothistroma septosporum NZE10]|uniref:RRM domain-containing protein n=1 Tax=Dothistroma septosporum (strain NZE10 / CBS 128990) TaxID=675120 RepID=N1PI16_DOTSN|nr:hypothetical protein DOTSEDRAFT_73158 [Dothistroma septosporum NZE10]